jgi:hypothetical protein
MYAWPVLFPPLTNREDLLVTVSLFDDDTGEPLDLVRRTLANPGDFTANVWTVTCGDCRYGLGFANHDQGLSGPATRCWRCR